MGTAPLSDNPPTNSFVVAPHPTPIAPNNTLVIGSSNNSASVSATANSLVVGAANAPPLGTLGLSPINSPGLSPISSPGLTPIDHGIGSVLCDNTPRDIAANILKSMKYNGFPEPISIALSGGPLENKTIDELITIMTKNPVGNQDFAWEENIKNILNFLMENVIESSTLKKNPEEKFDIYSLGAEKCFKFESEYEIKFKEPNTKLGTLSLKRWSYTSINAHDGDYVTVRNQASTLCYQRASIIAQAFDPDHLNKNALVGRLADLAFNDTVFIAEKKFVGKDSPIPRKYYVVNFKAPGKDSWKTIAESVDSAVILQSGVFPSGNNSFLNDESLLSGRKVLLPERLPNKFVGNSNESQILENLLHNNFSAAGYTGNLDLVDTLRADLLKEKREKEEILRASLFADLIKLQETAEAAVNLTLGTTTDDFDFENLLEFLPKNSTPVVDIENLPLTEKIKLIKKAILYAKNVYNSAISIESAMEIEKESLLQKQSFLESTQKIAEEHKSSLSSHQLKNIKDAQTEIKKLSSVFKDFLTSLDGNYTVKIAKKIPASPPKTINTPAVTATIKGQSQTILDNINKLSAFLDMFQKLPEEDD